MDVATNEARPTSRATETMRALVFRGPNQIALEGCQFPKLASATLSSASRLQRFAAQTCTS